MPSTRARPEQAGVGIKTMTSMPHLAVLDWDYADRLKHTQKGSGGGAQHTYFTYDAAGQRVRKAAVASGVVKERIYLGGYEIYRERAATPAAPIDFERQTCTSWTTNAASP